MALIKALNHANVMFQTQIYPDENHALPGVSLHLYSKMESFWSECFQMDSYVEEIGLRRRRIVKHGPVWRSSKNWWRRVKSWRKSIPEEMNGDTCRMIDNIIIVIITPFLILQVSSRTSPLTYHANLLPLLLSNLQTPHPKLYKLDSRITYKERWMTHHCAHSPNAIW